MSYSMMGAIGAASYKLVNGVAKPRDKQALDNFKAFQNELGRFGMGAVRADGAIGPATAKLYNKIVSGSFNVSQIAEGIPVSTMALKAMAVTKSLPPAPPLPPSQPIQKPDGTVSEGNPPPLTAGTALDTVMEFATSPLGLAAGAAVLGLLIMMKRRKIPAAPAPALTIPKVV